MKFILNRLALFGALVALSITLCRFAPAQTGGERRRKNKAIEALKNRGQYDSLIEAFDAARRDRHAANTPAAADTGATSNQILKDVFRILVDPWTQESFKVASDGATSDNFGYSVAMSGDTAIIGAIGDDVGTNADQGSAYVFVRSGTTWMQQQKLTAADGAANDNFGTNVAVSGNTVIVGAPISSNGRVINQGAAYVFVRSGTTWTQQQKLTAADGAIDDQFGTSVGISGDTAIVGASLDDVGANADQGSAYVFVRSGAAWTQQMQLVADDGLEEDSFGISVAVDGDTAVVGAFLSDVGANSDQGAAYVFTRTNGVWSQQQKLTATGGATEDLFGISASLSGATVVVGAPFDDSATADQGSAYIFARSGTIWTQQAQFIAADGAADDLFGNNVSVSGDSAVVSSYSSVGGNVSQGSAYVFSRINTTWTLKQKLTAANGAANDSFGSGVSISGTRIVVGVPLSDASASTPLAGETAKTEQIFAPTAADQGAAVFFVNSGPATAANVNVAGRILKPDGRGLNNAYVTLTNQSGSTRTAKTNPLGYYHFREVSAAQIYVISARAKHYQFSPQIVSIIEDIDDLNFIGNP